MQCILRYKALCLPKRKERFCWNI